MALYKRVKGAKYKRLRKALKINYSVIECWKMKKQLED